MKKHDGSNNFNGKGEKTQSNKSRVNLQKHKVDDRTSEYSKRGEGTSYQKYKQEKKSVQCYNYENGVTWLRIVGTRRTMERQKARMIKDKTLHVKIQMILMVWCL